MRLRFVNVAVAVAVAAVVLAPSAALAGGADLDKKQVDVDQDESGDTGVGAETGGGSGAGDGTPATAAPRPGVSCQYFNVLGPSGDVSLDPIDTPMEGLVYVLVCTWDDGRETVRTVIYDPGDPAPDVVTAAELAQQAHDRLEITTPVPRLNPDADHRQLVGVPTWMWLDDGSWDPITAEAEVPGLSVSATATPQRIIWNMGDGTEPIECDGPGTPYDTNRPPDAQHTDCSHIYQDAGTYDVTATVTWNLSWQASTGEGGDLDPANRSETLTIDVGEVQAVIVDG